MAIKQVLINFKGLKSYEIWHLITDHLNYFKKSTKGNLGIPKYLEIKQHTFKYSRLKDSVLLVINLAFIPKLMYRFNALLSKTKQGLFVCLWQKVTLTSLS